MPKYTVDGKQYAIPDNRIEDFEKKYPNATIEYYNDGDIYDIPLNKREVFLAKLPNATTQQPIAKEEQPKGLLSRLFGNDEEKAERSDFKQPLKASQEVNQDNTPNIRPITSDSIQPRLTGQPDVAEDEVAEFYNRRQELQKTANRQQVADLSAYIESQLERRGKELDAIAAQSPMMMQAHGTAMSIPVFDAGRTTDPEIRDYQAAKRAMENARNIINEADINAKNGKGSSFAAGAARGFGQKFFDLNTYDMGLSDLSDNAAMLKALETADENPDALTPSQQALLDAKAVELATNAYFGSSVGRGYKAGQVTAEAIPFMLEMAINPAKAVGQSLTNKLTRYALKRFGNKEIQKQGAKYVITKAGAKVLGDVAAASGMTATTGAARTAADAVQRMAGGVSPNMQREDGRVEFWKRTQGEESLIKAIAKAFAGTTIENYSEMMGEYFSPVLSTVGGLSAKALDKLGLGKVNRFIDDVSSSDFAQLVKDFEGHAKWNGTIGEFAEEIAGSVLNAAIVGDQTLYNKEGTGVFNKENLIDTFLGVSLLGGAFSGVKTAYYPIYKYEAYNAVNSAKDDLMEAFKDSENVEELERSLSTPQDAANALAKIAISPNFDPNKFEAAARYAQAIQRYNGALLGEQKRRTGIIVEAPEQLEVEQSYDNGRTLESPQEMNDANNQLGYAAAEVRKVFGLEEDADVDNFLGADPVTRAKEEQEKGEGTGQAILDYLYAKATYDGMIDGVRANIEAQQRHSDHIINQRANKEDGMIHPALRKVDDKPVYIVNGNIALNDDGTIDNEKSSESVVYLDTETGKLDFAKPSDFHQVSQPIDAEEEKTIARNQIAEELAQKASDKIDGVLPFQPNDVYPVLGADGTEHNLQVIADQGDGSVAVKVDGVDGVIPKDEIQQMANAYNLARRDAYNEERKAERMAEQEVIQPQAEQNTEQQQEQTPKRVIPTLKDGKTPDFNAMNSEMFVDEYVSRYGEDSAIKIARKNIANAKDNIAKIDKKIDDITDPNQMESLYVQRKDVEEQLNRYNDILSRLGASEDANETEADQQSRLKKEAGNRIASLFPNGMPNVESFILADIATGNRLRWSDKTANGAVTSKGLGAELGLSEAERRKRLPLIGKEAMTPEEYAESLKERLESVGIRYDESSLRDAVLDVYSSVDSRNGAWEALESIANKANEQEVDTDWESMQQERAYKQAQSVEENIPELPNLETIEEETPISEGEYAEMEAKAQTEEQKDYDAMMAENPPVEESVEQQIEVAEQDTNPQPTEAQKKAGNYKKGHIKIDGFDITIETPKGVERKGVDEKGNPWSVIMNNTYGYIRGTEGVDGDHIDMFLSDNLDNWNGNVYVIDQIKPDGSFDEHKVMYGFDAIEDAQAAYLSNYSEGWKGLGSISGTTKKEFKKWIASSHRKTKPFAEYKSVKTAEGQSVGQTTEDKVVEQGEKPKTPNSKADTKAKKLLIEPTKPDYTTVVAPSMVTMEVPMNVYKYVSKDKLNMYSGVYFDKDKYLVATDLFNLVALKVRDMQRSDADKFVTKQLEKKAEGTFNWRDILVPADKSIDGVIDFVDIVGKVGKKAKKNEKPKAVRIAYNGESILIPAERLQPLADFQKAVGIGDIRFANIGKDNNIPKIQINTGANVALAVGLDPKVAPYWSVYEYEVGGELTPPTSEKQESAPVENTIQKPEVPDVIRGDKWNATGEPTKMKFNRKGDNFDGYITVGKKKYGRTTSEGEELEILYEDYGNLENAWNAYERGDVFISPNLASIVKAILVDRYGDVKDTAEVDDGQQILFRSGDDVTENGDEYTIEEQQIIDNAKVNGTYLKAPNGKNTNLTPKQWVQVRTKAFKEWFGNWENDPTNASKVVDENGEPMVVYHRTPNKFTSFDVEKIGSSTDWGAFGKGFYFSPDAEQYRMYGDKTMALFLNARNPLMLDDKNAFDVKEPFFKDYSWGENSSEAFTKWVKDNGYDAVIYNDGYKEEDIVFNPNQIKSATDNVGTFDVNNDDIRFRSAESAPVFYSNAEYAVKAVKQEKATPEQWLKMIEKNGGLKAGEDKWLGLSDWLKSSDKKTLSKQEVLDFIKENQIQIEEVEYGNGIFSRNSKLNLESELKAAISNGHRVESALSRWDAEFGDNKLALYESGVFSIDENGNIHTDEPVLTHINRTRLNYTTEGLENNKEIALVVPTIESWNVDDYVHFGDAGNGRAIAWVRFGETTAESKESIAASEAVENYLAEMREKYGTPVGEETDAMSKSEISHLQRLTARELDSKEHGERVLVIDEVQSKRHQEGREKGYASEEVQEAQRQRDYLYKKMYRTGLTIEENERYYQLGEFIKNNFGIVPPAPFEKNWAELAMKRMLRYAAENGFDKIAWTTGEQQAERYDISKSVDNIKSEDNNVEETSDGTLIAKNITIYAGGSVHNLFVDANGIVRGREYDGKKLSDIVGKPLAEKLMEKGDFELEGDGLRIGGEGMKAFYDQMLPSFMNKYGKKWGVKVQNVTLPHLAKSSSVMHSIDVTDAMRESVMQGQPMFRPTELSNVDDAVEAKAEKVFNNTKAIATAYGIDNSIVVATSEADFKTKMLEAGVEDDYIDQEAIAVYIPETGEIVINSQKVASDKDLVESVVHEKAHNLTHNIDKWRNIYDAIIPVGEGRFVEFANNVLKENLSPIKSADEIIATFVGKSAILQTEDGRYLVRAMLNNRITSEDIISYLQSSFPSIYAQYGDVLTAMHPFIQDSLETIKKQYNERRNNVSVSRVGRETRPSNGGDAYRELATPTSDRGSSTIEGVSGVRREPSERRGRTVEERTQSRILAATTLAESLGVKLNVIEDVNDITDANSTMQRAKRGAKAWYVVATDQVYFVAPNATSIQDAEESVLHEVVAHKGLRDVVGRERFDAFLGKVYRGASPEIRKAITKLAAKNGWDFRVATEEYLASLAERGFEDKENRTFWEKVRDLFMDMLREAKIMLGYNINDNDMRYMLWRTYQMQKSKGVMAAAEDVVMQQKLGVGNFRTRPVGEDDRVNTLFNEQLSKLNEETKDKIVLSLGYPSETLLGAGVKNKQMKLYGSKVFAKMKKHGFDVSELKDLPKAVAKPIAVFNNYETDVNRSILTELTTKDGNFLVSVKIGEGEDVEFNIVTSVFGKGDSKIANWISKGYGVYFDKEKTLNYLHHSAPIAEALSNSELSSITKIVENFENPTIEGTKNEPSSKVLFRSAGNQAAEDKRKAIRAEYDKIVNTGRKGTLKATKYNFIESMQDEMLSLKEYQELLKKHYGLEKLPSYLDAYMRENRISSAGYEEFLRFEDGVYEDMNSIIDEYINKGETYDNIKEYAIAKSGLERNREFTVRDYIDDKANEKLISKTEAEAQLAQVVEDLKNDVITPTEADAKRQQIQNLRSQNKLNAEDVKALKEDYAKKRDAYRKQLSDGHISYSEFNKLSDALAKKFTGRSIEDYSGLSAMAEKKGEKADKWQTVAQDVVEAFESKHKDTDKLWNAIKACNDAVLKKMSDSGLLNDDVYSHLRQQFVWYIPMSGFTEDTAEDVYSYVGNETGAFTPAVKKAAGRLSESDDPFAIIGNKMQGAILQGNRNLLKQTLLNLSRTYPTDLITEDKVWLVKQQDGTWETNMVDIPEGATSEEAAKLIKEHSEKMRKLKKQGLAMEQTNKLSVPYKVTVRSHKNDHEIVAYRNGVPVVMYVNGNPQLAKAINGKLKDRNINKFYELLDKLNRIMSANKTSWNPDFIAPNVLRDFEDAILSTFIDAGVKDAAKLAKTVMLVFPEVVRSVSGSKNKSGKYANYFEEFLQNGGETGYSHLRDVEKWKEINQRRWKRLNLGEKALKAPKEAFDGIGSMFSYLNRIAEDSTRFGTYVYNREKGKSIGESIKAAKDITTNFNKKGSGATEGIWGFLANFMRRWLLFFNPMVQGLYKHWERMTKNSMRYALVFAAMAGGGYLAAVLNKAASDDDDEEKKYFNQSDYTRRTNIMVYTGDGYVKIPLAPVFREMYALGDIMYSVQSGVITPWEGTKEVVNIVRSLFSLEGQSSLKDQDFSWFRFVIPQSTEFMADIEDNVTFTGVPLYKDTPWNKFDPEYQKVYKGTWTPLVKLSKAVNDILPHEGYMHEVDDQMAGKGSSKWINPAVWQHIIEEVAGGVGKTIGDVITVGDNILNKKETDIYNIPIAKRFYSEPDERTRGRILKNQYYNATGELEKMNNKYKKYTDYLLDNLSDPLEIAAKITEYWDSDAGKMHTLIKDSKSKIDNLDKQLKEAKDDATAKEITLQKENEMNNLIESLKVNEEANALLR